jgi:hypothetical protein
MGLIIYIVGIFATIFFGIHMFKEYKDNNLISGTHPNLTKLTIYWILLSLYSWVGLFVAYYMKKDIDKEFKK